MRLSRAVLFALCILLVLTRNQDFLGARCELMGYSFHRHPSSAILSRENTLPRSASYMMYRSCASICAYMVNSSSENGNNISNRIAVFIFHAPVIARFLPVFHF